MSADRRKDSALAVLAAVLLATAGTLLGLTIGEAGGLAVGIAALLKGT